MIIVNFACLFVLCNIVRLQSGSDSDKDVLAALENQYFGNIRGKRQVMFYFYSLDLIRGTHAEEERIRNAHALRKEDSGKRNAGLDCSQRMRLQNNMPTRKGVGRGTLHSWKETLAVVRV